MALTLALMTGLFALVGSPPGAAAARSASVSIGNVSISEGLNRVTSRPAVVPVTLDRPVGRDVVVKWKIKTGGSAQADDVLTRSGQIVIKAGTTADNFSVIISGDLEVEGAETVVVAISSPDVAVARSQGLITIRDLQDEPGLTVSDIVIPEPGDSGFAPAVLTVQIPGPAPTAIEVRWSTKAKSPNDLKVASPTSDYKAESGTTVIAAGQRSARIVLTIRADNTYEPKEEFTVKLDAKDLKAQLPGWHLDTAATVTIVEHPRVVVASGLDTTGRTDSTTKLQTILDAAGYNTIVRLPGNAQLRVDGTLRITSKNQFVLDGNQATIFTNQTGAIDRTHVMVESGSAITIRDLTIRGSHPAGGAGEDAYNPDREFQHGIWLKGVRGAEITATKITDVYGDFVYIGREPDNPLNRRRWSSDVWIHNNSFTRNGRQGIAITAGRDILIEQNLLFNVHRATIDFEPNTEEGGANNVHVVSNIIGEGRLLFVAARGEGTRVDNVVVAQNLLIGRTLNMSVGPPAGGDRFGWFVIGNMSDTAANQTAIRIERTHGVIVEGNLQNFTVPEPAVTIKDGCGKVQNNFFGARATAGSAKACNFAVSPPGPPEPLYF